MLWSGVKALRYFLFLSVTLPLPSILMVYLSQQVFHSFSEQQHRWRCSKSCDGGVPVLQHCLQDLVPIWAAICSSVVQQRPLGRLYSRLCPEVAMWIIA